MRAIPPPPPPTRSTAPTWSKGQTGLSVAFDLPTQTGYDSDHVLARGEVGKVGVPVCHLGDMRALFDGSRSEQMNTSMTINATAAWLLALYIAVAEEQGADVSLQGTVQNDIIKEYLSAAPISARRNPILKMIADVAEFCYTNVPKWNPMNVCSYHLQEAGATPEQELAFALATATAVLDALKPRVPAEDFPAWSGRISFFVNAGIRFRHRDVQDARLCRSVGRDHGERYGVEDPKFRRFRYGVQVNSLGLTEQQPENNVYRILIEMLAVTLSKNARARAVQLPAWNEALGLPRPWDQQWSMRMQQILALKPTFWNSTTYSTATRRSTPRSNCWWKARGPNWRIDDGRRAISAIDYMKGRLVESQRRPAAPDRKRRNRRGRRQQMAARRALAADDRRGDIMVVDPAPRPTSSPGSTHGARARRGCRETGADRPARRGAGGENIMPASIAAAKAGVTTGEWAAQMRAVLRGIPRPDRCGAQASPTRPKVWTTCAMR